jgi:hypothetical protein
MRSRMYQREEKKKQKTPHSLNSLDSGMLQRCPFTMQLKTLSQQPDLKTSFSQTERYGHHLDTIQCAGLSNGLPIQMSTEEDEELASGIILDTSKLNNNQVLEQGLSIASSTNSYKNHEQKHLAENRKEKVEKVEKEKKQNSEERLKSQATNNLHQATVKLQNHIPEGTIRLNNQIPNNLVSPQKLMPPPPTYDDKKNTPTPRYGTRGQYIKKREAMNIIGEHKEFAATQRAVKQVPAKDTPKSDSKAEDSKQQVKLKNAAELVRDEVTNGDRQVKEHIQAKLNIDPEMIAQEGGEQLILQKTQS